MSDQRADLLALFAKTSAERFDTFKAWAEAADLPPRLARFYADRAPDSWWAVAFNTYRRHTLGA